MGTKLHTIRMVFARETKLAGGITGLVAGALVSGASMGAHMAYRNMPSTAVGRNMEAAVSTVGNHLPSADGIAQAGSGAIDNFVTGGVEGPTYKMATRKCRQSDLAYQ